MNELVLGDHTNEPVELEQGVMPNCSRKPAKAYRYYCHLQEQVVISCYCEFFEESSGFVRCEIPESEFVRKPKQELLSFMESER